MNAIDRTLRESRLDKAIELETRYSAPNYAPLPVVLTRGEDSYLWDTAGKRYVDMMSAYSAVSLGHAHPRILAALTAQANRLAVPSRAYYSDRLGPFLAEICRLTGLDAVIPMNTGAEAVETAIKAARRWGYRVKGIAKDKAEIIVAAGNFHGRTTTIRRSRPSRIIATASARSRRASSAVPFGDLAAVERAITPETAAVLIEPIQGEAGIVVPPDGYLAGLRGLCDDNSVLLILDEVQSGLGRTGRWFAYRARGHPARRADPRQGAGRRRAAGVGLRRHARTHGRVHAGLARLDLRRQSARRGCRARSAARHPRREARREEPRRRRLHARAPARDQKPGAEGRARPRPVGRRRDRPADRYRARGLRAAPRQGRALEGDARHRGAARAAAHHRARRPRLRARAHRGGGARSRNREAARGRSMPATETKETIGALP